MSKMLPSWSEFWGRIDELRLWAGGEMYRSELHHILCFVAVVILPIVVHSVSMYFIFLARYNIKHLRRAEYTTTRRKVLTALADVGIVVLALFFAVFFYGLCGTRESLEGMGGFAASEIGLWSVIFYARYESEVACKRF